jgi:hypothetical protein
MSLMMRPDSEIQQAREIARGCPTGCLVVHEMGTDNVFYKNVHTNKEIKTNFTAQQVEIAHRDIPHTDPDHLEWEHGNSMIQNRYQVYKANGK